MSAAGGESVRALVVDDNAANRRLICLALSVDGFEAEAVSTVAEAKAELERRTPEVVLVDLSLPDAHGTDLVRWIRSQPAGNGVPVVAVSASAREEDVAEALAAGSDHFIPKPVDTRAFGTEIREMIARRRPRTASA